MKREIAGNAVLNGYMTNAATNAGIKLTMPHRKFYFNLLGYAIDNNCDKNSDGDFVVGNLSVPELAEMTEQPLRTTIKSIAQLVACGLIERTERNGRIPCMTIIKNTNTVIRSLTMIDIDIFENNERIIINSAADGMPVSALDRDTLLKNLAFQRSVAGEQDMKDLVDGLYSKIEKISPDEWNYLRLQIPFPVFIDADNEVAEVPDETV